MIKLTAIEDMMNGWRGNTETFKPSRAYFQQADKVTRLITALEEKLQDRPECIEQLNTLLDESIHAESIIVDEHYAEGFRFGVLLGMDILSSINDKNE